ncbi:zinc-binding dehydrogenase [uncultured Alsobacter sp.]|uniref:zinc-binding dehydrogenase n=1 Tax=uncultured Alsobacter sp. TaxID=1748258 RepID=UPI0025E0A60B|nr:zinc-binding dehydrogenase [uncultured Alsobacter sp.]
MAHDALELRTLISAEGELRITLEPVTIADPGAGEIVVRVEAAPINPSDLGLLLGPADPSTLAAAGSALVARVSPAGLSAVQGRVGQAMPAGNEGAGTVIAAAPDVAHLVGRKVGMIGGGMYATLRKIAARDCIVLPEGIGAAEGAALFVNPLTALGFVETMRMDGHKAIVHTAAASNLGQMLVLICKADGIPLVNVVRNQAQVDLLRGLGAEHVVDSSRPDFDASLAAALAATGATLAFDAIGGGDMASRILNAMEAVAVRSLPTYSRYGSTVAKQVYIYGALDMSPLVLRRGFGFTWNVGGWLLFNFLQKAGRDVAARMRQRVVDEIRTTFASRYTRTVGLADMLKPDVMAAANRKSTGEKILVDPSA